MDNKQSFLNYVKAGYALLMVRTHEEARVLADFMNQIHTAKISSDKDGEERYSTYVWDFVDGVVKYTLVKKSPEPERDMREKVNGQPNPKLGHMISQTPGQANFGEGDGSVAAPLIWLDQKAGDNTILFLRDYHPYMRKDFQEWHALSRKIKNLLPTFKSAGKVLVLVGPTLEILPELEKEITVIDYRLPDREDLRIQLQAVCDSANAPFPDGTTQKGQDGKSVKTENVVDEVLDAALGMTVVEAENAFSVSLVEAHKFDPSIVRREKALIIKKTKLLEVVETTDSLEDIGGLEYLKEYLIARAKTFTAEAKKFGISALRGLLFAGVPGCGKSLMAKAVSTALRRPLLRLDMGKIFGKYVGESEDNMASCLHLAEAVSPCVLWIDELEKSIAGNNAGSGQEGHETTRRVFQLLLTWLQEKKADVLLVATANSLDSLPPELLRAGRIDSTWWVDLPDAEQRLEILKIHLRKAGRDAKNFELAEVVSQTGGFSGAELEVLIKEALVRAFTSGHKDLEVQDILGTIPDMTPVSKMQGDKIERQRAKAKADGIKPASRSHAPIVPATAVHTDGKRKVRYTPGPAMGQGPIGGDRPAN